MSYYIRYQGRKQGPLSEAQLVTLLTRGTVTKETETSLNEADWMPLGEFPEFERFYSQVIAKQVKQESSPAAPLSISTYGLQPSVSSPPSASDHTPGDDIFALAGFSSKESNKKLDEIMKQTTAEPATMKTTRPATQEPVEKKSLPLYAIMGGAATVLVLVVVLAIVFSGPGQPVARQAEVGRDEVELSEPELSEPGPAGRSLINVTAETTRPERIVIPVATEQTEQVELEIKEVELDAATEQEIKEVELDAATEQSEKENHPLVTESDDKPMGSQSPPASAVPPQKSVFPVKMLSLDAFGGIALPSTVNGEFADLYPIRGEIQFKYVSYVPGDMFSSENLSGHDLRVSRYGSDILRFSLVEGGLEAEWLDSPVLTTMSYKTLNGAVLAELEVLRADTNQVLKTVSLFEPIQKSNRFSMSNKQVVLEDLDIDLNALKLDDNSLQIARIRNLYKGGKRETISDDTIRYFFLDDGKEYKVDIRAIAQAPLWSNDDIWRIPIHPEAEFLPSREDMDMINKIRSFIGLNADRTRALSAENARRKNRAVEIAGEIDAGPRVTAQVLTEFDKEFRAKKNVLNRKNAAAYKKFLEVVKNYRERLDKAKRITMIEPIYFDIELARPDNEEKTILLVEVGAKEK